MSTGMILPKLEHIPSSTPYEEFDIVGDVPIMQFLIERQYGNKLNNKNNINGMFNL